MKNYIQEGRMITVAAPTGGATSGDGVVIGALFEVASKTAAAGETVTLATTGVFDLPKLASAVIAAGDPVAGDDTAKQVNVPATGRYPIGSQSRQPAMARQPCACGSTVSRRKRRNACELSWTFGLPDAVRRIRRPPCASARRRKRPFELCAAVRCSSQIRCAPLI